jgi:hypothetical protein
MGRKSKIEVVHDICSWCSSSSSQFINVYAIFKGSAESNSQSKSPKISILQFNRNEATLTPPLQQLENRRKNAKTARVSTRSA